jgi:hypothetical protein
VTEQARARAKLFDAESPQLPSSYLADQGWKGNDRDLRQLDEAFQHFRESATDEQKESISGIIAGIGMAVSNTGSEVSDIKIVPSDVRTEQATVRHEFETGNKDGLESGAISQSDYDEGLAAALQTAEYTAAHYNGVQDKITVILDAKTNGGGMAESYGSLYSSSPSPSHIGYHECVHARNFRNIREQAGLPRTGLLSESDTSKLGRAMQLVIGDTVLDKGNSKFLTRDDARDASVKYVSQYGASSPFEMVAEYVTGVELGGIKRSKTFDMIAKSLKAPEIREPKNLSERQKKIIAARDEAISKSWLGGITVE